MAQYTVELKTLIDSGYDIGLDTYPIFDESYRGVLNQKIVDHFLFREIGAETPGRFRHYLNRTMNEIMPYYNQRYKSELINILPLVDYSESETTSRTSSGTTDVTGTSQSAQTSSNTQTDDQLRVDSDTPQGLLSVPTIKDNAYASQAARSDNRSEASGSTSQTTESQSGTSGSSLEEFVRTASGHRSGKSQAQLVKEFRESFLNIDLEVIRELESCFMGVY